MPGFLMAMYERNWHPETQVYFNSNTGTSISNPDNRRYPGYFKFYRMRLI